MLIEGEQHGASDYVVTLGEPLHNNVTGDSAYVVVPATMTFKVHGKQVTQTGAVFTVALRKLAEGGGSRPGRGRKAQAAIAMAERTVLERTMLQSNLGEVRCLSSTTSSTSC